MVFTLPRALISLNLNTGNWVECVSLSRRSREIIIKWKNIFSMSFRAMRWLNAVHHSDCWASEERMRNCCDLRYILAFSHDSYSISDSQASMLRSAQSVHSSRMTAWEMEKTSTEQAARHADKERVKESTFWHWKFLFVYFEIFLYIFCDWFIQRRCTAVCARLEFIIH